MSADHLQLVETVGRHEDEMRRWADKLAPKHISGDDCCTYSCTGCPVRETAAEPNWWPVLDKLPAPKYCERAKQHCTTPWTCNPLCRLIDSQLPIEMFEQPSWYQRPAVLYAVVGVGACIGFALALYQTF